MLTYGISLKLVCNSRDKFFNRFKVEVQKCGTNWILFLSLCNTDERNIWGWSCSSNQICAIRGSTVVINCTYRDKSYSHYGHTVQEISCLKNDQKWIPKGDSNPRERVQCRCVYAECTLSISDITHSDSAEYKFRLNFRESQKSYYYSPGVILSVKGNSHTDSQFDVSFIAINLSVFR